MKHPKSSKTAIGGNSRQTWKFPSIQLVSHAGTRVNLNLAGQLGADSPLEPLSYPLLPKLVLVIHLNGLLRKVKKIGC